MQEVVGHFTNQPLGSIYFCSLFRIHISVVGTCIMPAGYGIGDHRLFVIDKLSSLIMGEWLLCIVCLQAQWLKIRISWVAEAYCQWLETLILKHRVIKCTRLVHDQSGSIQEAKAKLDPINKEHVMKIQETQVKADPVSLKHQSGSKGWRSTDPWSNITTGRLGIRGTWRGQPISATYKTHLQFQLLRFTFG